jgi:hypothetical protein
MNSSFAFLQYILCTQRYQFLIFPFSTKLLTFQRGQTKTVSSRISQKIRLALLFKATLVPNGHALVYYESNFLRNENII